MAYVSPKQRSLVNYLTERFTAEDYDHFASRLIEAVDATQVVRGTQHRADGTRQYAELPDWQVRLAALAMINAYTAAKPAAEIHVEASRVDTPEQMQQRVLSNLDGFMGVLEHMQRLQKEKQPVDVTPAQERLES